MVDDKVVVYVYPNAVISRCGKSVCSRCVKVEVSFPFDREGVCSEKRIRGTVTPVEIDRRIGSRNQKIGEINIVVVTAVESIGADGGAG